jgi:hypothetical protein
LVDREPVVSDEEVAHGDVQVTLALAVPRRNTRGNQPHGKNK